MILSILIPTYNRLKYIKRQLNFLKNENIDYEDIEIIVSNNCSNDETEKLLSEISKTMPIKVYNQSANIGLIGNFRFLIKQARGNYIWIIGDDDILKTGTISHVLSCIKNNDGLHHIFLNYSIVREKEIIKEQVVNIKSGLYFNGKEMFFSAVNSYGFGTQMYITANIFQREQVIEYDRYVENINETDNLAYPLGMALWCSFGKSYHINRTYIMDEYAVISWRDSYIKVFGRDMIAILDKVANKCNISKEIGALIVKKMPMDCPEFYYLKYRKQFNKDNYTFWWLLRKHPFFLLKDTFKIIKILFIKKIKMYKD